MKLGKYLELFIAFFKASFIADLEYRLNFVSHILIDVMWYGAQIISMEVLFRHTTQIGHWGLPQVRVFLGLLFIIDSFYMIFLDPNIGRLSDRVRKGELDMLLSKPVNSQFMVSFQKMSTANIGNLVMSSAWFVFAVNSLPQFHWMQAFWLILIIPMGMLVFYTIRFCFSATAVIFSRSENIQFLWYQIFKLGIRPDSIYVPWFRIFVLTVLPVAMIASVPARVLLDEPNWLLIGWMCFYSPLLVYLSTLFWKFCLKHYSSASS